MAIASELGCKGTNLRKLLITMGQFLQYTFNLLHFTTQTILFIDFNLYLKSFNFYYG